MEQMYGIKESLEVLEAVKVIGVKVAKAGKDGFDFSDLSVLVDPEVWAKAKAAFEGIGEAPKELKELNAEEIGQLAAAGLAVAFAVYAAIKEPKNVAALEEAPSA